MYKQFISIDKQFQLIILIFINNKNLSAQYIVKPDALYDGKSLICLFFHRIIFTHLHPRELYFSTHQRTGQY